MKHQNVKSYVPIQQFYQDKDRASCQLLYEDCVVLNARDGWRTVAQSRGSFTPLTAEEQLCVSRAFDSDPSVPCFLPHPSGTVALFGVWYHELGLVPALLIYEEREFVKESYRRFLQSDAWEMFSLLDERQMRLRELFLECARLFSDPLQAKVAPLVLSVAAFAGCRLHCVSIPSRDGYLGNQEAQKICAYLLCVFLDWRRRTGEIDVRGSHGAPSVTENQALLAERMSVDGEYDLWISQKMCRRVALRTEPAAEVLSDLCGLPCFAGYELTFQGDELSLCIPLRRHALLGATSQAANTVLCLRILPRTRPFSTP